MIAPATKSAKPRRANPEEALQAIPLYSRDAEQAVLSSMLTQPDQVIDFVLEKLVGDDFFVPALRELFGVLKDLHERREAIDITTVHQYLIDHKLADAIGSPGILAELAGGLSTHLNVHSYIRIVKDKSLLRHLQTACSTIAQSISDSPDNVTQVLDNAETTIFRITDLGVTNSTVAAREEIVRAITLVENFQKRKGKLFGIPTGFEKLNELTTGWQKGDMIVLAARPGVGKTALALTFAKNAMCDRYDDKLDNWVKPGYSVGMFSLEMTNAQLMLRLLSSYSGKSLQKIRKGDLTEEDMHDLRLVADQMKEEPLCLDDSSYLTINQLRAKARRMKQRYDIEFLIIDYLQLLHSESDQAKDNRQNEVAEISRGIKALAKELQIPIMVLAQLNRKSEEGKTEPALHNLRESGAIEQDADIVLLLHRLEEKDDNDKDGDGGDDNLPPVSTAVKQYSLNIAKQRSGPTDKVDMLFNSWFTRFEDPLRHQTRR